MFNYIFGLTVPNYLYTSSGEKHRFFPFEKIVECQSEEEYQAVLNESSNILRNTMKLYTKKWSDKKVGISLTGGADSAVTFSSANDNYDFFKCFSYVSKEEEAVDAKAAEKICSSMGLPHVTITIDNQEMASSPGQSALKEIIAFNGGNIGYLKPNEICKRYAFLNNALDIDIEVKSWVDEITRAYRYKQYGSIHFPQKPNGRYLATFYKVFLENRLLYQKTVRVFDNYIREYMKRDDLSLFTSWLIPWSWEFAHSAGNGQHMTDEQILAFDVAVPFNNRHLISTMLRVKLEDRIADRLQKDIVQKNNPKQAALNIAITNVAHTSIRANIEKAYLIINTHLPF